MAENIPIGTVILEIQATDGDEPATGSSLIVYQVKEGDPNNTFIIETDSETNRGFVKINKVNRWILLLSFSVTYLSYTVSAPVMICGEGCWLVVGWEHPKHGADCRRLHFWTQALCLCSAHTQQSSCVCCAFTTRHHHQLPPLALLLAASPAEQVLANEVGLYAP